MSEINDCNKQLKELFSTKEELNNLILKGKPDSISNDKWLEILDSYNKVDNLIRLVNKKIKLEEVINKVGNNG